MKTIGMNKWAAVCVSTLMVAGFSVLANNATTAAKQENHFTGIVSSVNTQEHLLHVKGFLFGKTFHLGDNCAYTFVGKGAGAISDLRPGEKVTVGYESANGVRVADSIMQKPMRYHGMVKAIDPAQHTMTLHSGIMNKTLQLPETCQVALHGDKSGALADIQPGDRVIVTYETPNGKPTAEEIAQNSATFSGAVTAIDLGNKTLKAKATFSTKKFVVGDNCAIVVNGKTNGQLTDLKPGEKLMFNYDTVNGVNIVNRIGPVAETASHTAELNQHYTSMP